MYGSEDELSNPFPLLSERSGSKKMFCITLLCIFLKIFLTRFCSVAQAGLQLMIFLSQPPERWSYSCVPLCPGSLVLLFLGSPFLTNYVMSQVWSQ